MLAIGAALVTQALQAQSNPGSGDLVLGITGGGSTNDLIVDLGSSSSLLHVGNVTSVDLGTTLAAFQTQFTVGTTLNAGVVGGISRAGSPNPGSEIWTTVASGGSQPNRVTSRNNVTSAAGDVLALQTGFQNNSGDGDVYSFTYEIAATPSTGAIAPAGAGFSALTGLNPLNAFSAGGLLTMDIWSSGPTAGTTTQPFVYDGSVTLNFSSSGELFANVTAVPEPSTYSMMIAAGGLMTVMLRRKVSLKKS